MKLDVQKLLDHRHRQEGTEFPPAVAKQLIVIAMAR